MTPTWRFGSTVLLLAGSLGFSIMNDRRRPQPLAHPLESIEKSIDGWSGTDDPPLADRIEASLAATSYLSRTYRRGSGTINLFIAYYEKQRAGESMHSPKYCLPGGGWEMIDSGSVIVRVDGRALRISNYQLSKTGARSRILYWYQAPYRTMADEYLTKMYLVWDAIRHGQTSGSIVRLTLDERPQALPEGTEFAAQVVRQVRRCFGTPGA
jgi:EpsI family protein